MEHEILRPTYVPRVYIRKISFSDNTTIEIGNDDVIVIVGPNNSGKSATLRCIRDTLIHGKQNSPVIRDLEYTRNGSNDQLADWLSTWTVPLRQTNNQDIVLQAHGYAMHCSEIGNRWTNSDIPLAAMSRWFCHLLTAEDRLLVSVPAPSIDISADNPTHPTHFLQKDEKLETRLSNQFRNAFGKDLFLNRAAGNKLPLLVGRKPVPVPPEDRLSTSYLLKIKEFPSLESQGDGMRSYAGVLLHTSTGRESIMLVDEPEAFLHPPQARLLGSVLVKERAEERQLFVATHSADILRGILDAESPNVRVLRIRRSEDENFIKLLDNSRINSLWKDPLLRYSNIFDALFHESVVICESDSDCRFFAAILDSMVSKQKDIRRPDLMFTHCGGKDRIPVVVRALRQVDVPLKIVVDFDVLRDLSSFKAIVEALDIDWAVVEPSWKKISHDINSRKPDRTLEDFKSELGKLLESVDESYLPTDVARKINSLLKKTSSWETAKRTGKVFLSQGHVTQVCEELLRMLEKSGLHVVDCGELESFVRTVDSHGPKWVNQALALDLNDETIFGAARQFVSKLL